jgi:phosphatidylinositol 3-kinase
MDKDLKRGGMDLCITTFKVLATAADTGIMEFVGGSYPVSEVLHTHDNSILAFFRKHQPARAPSTGIYGVDPEV